MLETYLEDLFTKLKPDDSAKDRMWAVKKAVDDVERLTELSPVKDDLIACKFHLRECKDEIAAQEKTIKAMEERIESLEGRRDNTPKMAKRVLATVTMPKARATRHARAILAWIGTAEFVIAMQFGDAEDQYDESWDNGKYVAGSWEDALEQFMAFVKQRKNGFFGCEEHPQLGPK